jgi:hypothetical protein
VHTLGKYNFICRIYDFKPLPVVLRPAKTSSNVVLPAPELTIYNNKNNNNNNNNNNSSA